MRRYFIIWTLLIVWMGLQGASLQLSKLSQNEYKVDFNLPEYETKTTLNDGVQSQKLTISGTEADIWKENLNGLPQTEQWVYVPNGYRAEVSLQNRVIIHRQNYDCDTDDTINTGAEWMDVSQQMRFRGNNLVSFVIKPFTYNKSTRNLGILTSAQISIRMVADAAYTYRNADRYLTPTTVQMMKALCLNRDDIREVAQKPGSYLIIYNGTIYETTIQTLADWKHQKGFDVRMINTANIAGGNTTTAIKAYLQTAYDTWSNPPEFIILLGKSSGTNSIPTYTEYFNYNTVGDYKYTQLDGTDLFPDAYIGRVTFSNTTELQTILNKTINYEKYANLSTTDWSNRALLVGDPSNSGASCITTVNYIKGLILGYNPDALFSEVTSSPFPSQISAALNNPGVNAYWYRGHGDFSGWSQSNTNSLTNTGRLPFFSYITCFTVNFNGNSMGESFMKVGTSASAKGAVAVVGSSCETHTCINNILTGGIAQGFYVDNLAKAGPAMVRGKLSFLANYPQNPSDYLSEYSLGINLLGDPAIDIWLKPVTDITVTFPPSMYQAGGNAAIRVLDIDGQPVPNAWVTLLKGSDELFATGYTDDEGMIVLAYNAVTVGNVKLTVTKPDFRTFQTTITVSDTPAQVTLNPIPALAQCHAGSTIAFPVSITNYNTNLTAVTGVLSTLDADISITQGNVTFGNVDAGASATSAQNCIIALSPQMVKGKSFYLNLQLTHSTGTIDLPILCTENGANLIIGQSSFGNNLLAHGTNNLNIRLNNESATDVSGLTAVLESTHPLATISNPSQTIGTISGNSTFTFPAQFSITVADSLPEGVTVTFYLDVSNTSGFQQRLTISKVVGAPTQDDITGPDSYGYICYGTGDAGAHPYNWIELDPSLGGTGTNLNLSDTDLEGSGVFSTITMPFQFRYYGIVYSQVTICSNGFIMPGSQGSAEWMNWSIPGAMVPRPIIAPFWDDLLTDATGRVLYKYDATLHAFIVQWQDMRNRYSVSQRETFEAVLYDPFYVSSPTGDSPILFQYKLFNNVDLGNYGGDYVDHGQYATVGIGDHTGLIGLEYSFNNTYPGTAQPITNFSTLYFTTLPNYLITPNPIILNSQVTEVNGNGNGMIDAGELIDLGIVVKNTGLGGINETTATLTSDDPYVMVIQGQATLAALFSNQMATTSPLFRIQVTQNCPNLHTASFTLTLHNAQYTFPLNFDLSIHAINITMTNLQFIDGNDGFPAPGETVNMTFDLNNDSMLDANSISVLISPPTGVTVNPLNQVISLPANTHQTMSYSVAIGNNVPQGEEMLIGLSLTITGVYSSQFDLPCLVGAADVMFASGFEETDPWVKWIQRLNVVIDPAQYINPTGNEAVLFFTTGNPNSYVLSNFILANDILGGQISFKYQNLNPGATFGVQVSYNSGQSFSPLWSTTAQNDTPQEMTIPLTNIPPETVVITYLFLASRNGNTNEAVILDDVSIKAVHHAPGIISGNVSLDLYPENVTQADVQLLFTDTVIHPDAQGNFQIPAYGGENYVSVALDGYRAVNQFTTVTVVSGQTTAGQNIAMQRLRAPINLTGNIESSLLTLNWGLEGGTKHTASSVAIPFTGTPCPRLVLDNPIHLVNYRGMVKSDAKDYRFLSPNYYKVVLKRNNFTIQDTTTATTYTRTLALPGEYRIYVQGVYVFEDGSETYSDSSNVLVLTYTANEDNIVKPVFALEQNFPNPFNPTTAISFAIPAKQAASLVIYNVKGQVVKTLLDAETKEGAHTIVWNGKDDQNKPVGSGIYYYRLKTGSNDLTRKMILMK